MQGWFLDSTFKYINQLKPLLLSDEMVDKKGIEKKLRPAGRLKLVLVSGIFIRNTASEVDLLIVGTDSSHMLLKVQ